MLKNKKVEGVFMQNGWLLRKGFVSFMTLCLLFTLWPAGESPLVEAAGNDLEITLQGGGRIGNLSHSPTNALVNFQTKSAGFEYDKDGSFSTNFSDGDLYLFKDDSIVMYIDVSDNALLKEIASSGHATVEYGWDRLYTGQSGGGLDVQHQKTKGKIFVYTKGGDPIDILFPTISDESTTEHSGSKSGSKPLTENTVIRIEISSFAEKASEPSGVRGLYVRFKDQTRPIHEGYTFTGNGVERLNSKGQRELYVKENEYIDVTYKFSEAVYPTAIFPSFSDHFLRHPLFVNRGETGLPAAGQQQYMRNTTYTSSTLGKLHENISYRYTGVKYHDSGNLPLEPAMQGTSGAILPMNLSLEEKLNEAVLADAAGNIAAINMAHKADNSSNGHVRGKASNPFDYNNKGYRIIVDAVEPKYTKTGNGIQPEIVTGVVLNRNDTIPFSVQFTEEMIPQPSQDIARTYLLLSNGMRAYYVSGEYTNTWTFELKVNDAKAVETPLLKVIALTHEEKDTDTRVLQDYAGNMLLQPANFDGMHEDAQGVKSQINSKIDWADLSIDNTPTALSFNFEAGGATNTQYEKNGKITIDANDPTLLVPALDPVNTGLLRPSKGIYRPSNMTGESSPALGLVYYLWSQSAEDPFIGKAADHHAAVKRYSLSAKQPREDLYIGEFPDLNLSVANNKTNMLAPPAQARLPENSGIWYLHAWTADMTWDSARELMQYDKKKSYVASNPTQYEAWKSELPDEASEQDREFYAETKALAAVGQYQDLSVWTLADFKKDDSNWTYAATAIWLDNQQPLVVFEGIEDDRTKVVQVPVAVSDPHSGIQEAMYQFAAIGQAPDSTGWEPLPLNNGKATVSTLNHVVEDGAYTLHVKAADRSGNQLTTSMEQAVTVDSTSSVRAGFYPDSNSAYTKAHDIVFEISGITPKLNQIKYAMIPSSLRPTDPGVYKALAGTTVTGSVYGSGGSVTGSVYSGGGSVTGTVYGTEQKLRFNIPGDPTKNGLQYIHVIVESEDDNRVYTYLKGYYFDNEAPSITFNRSGSLYALEYQEVSVAILESYSVNGRISKFQWIAEGNAIPDKSSADWRTLPGDGVVSMTNETLANGQTADYRLFVYAVDGAGNEVIVGTSPFRVSKPATTESSSGESNLLFTYYSGEGEYTAIIKLDLDSADKRGYEYALSPDGGDSWLRWKPYTNFVSIKVPTGEPEQLNIQVKFRVNGGEAGTPISLKSDKLDDIEPVYALATPLTTSKVKSATGVELLVTPGLGVRVVPTEDNPMMPIRIGNSNTFKVKGNGYYSFHLTDMTDSSRTGILYAVVNNIDDTIPTGEAVLINTLPTNQNVTAKLIYTSEPVQITNNNGRNVYTFTENGTFTFEFKDEAGNEGTATVTANIIDKQAPAVRIVQSYQSADQQFATIQDEARNVVAASGVVVSVEKSSPDAKDFFVPGGATSIVLWENGMASFMVSDQFGNMTKVQKNITNIVSKPPMADTVTYTFVGANGQPLSENEKVVIGGQTYAKGAVQVTVSGTTIPGNPVFAGLVSTAQSGGGYTNQISGRDGTFQLTRVFAHNGPSTIALTDLLGNRIKLPVDIKGLDNTPPEISLNRSRVAVVQGKENFDFIKDLGGFSLSDNLSAPENIRVGISGLDLKHIGEQRVTYTVTDQVGNSTTVEQVVIVTGNEGMFIYANGQLISTVTGETVLFETNHLTFAVEGYQRIAIDGMTRTNELGTYDILYYSGLFREGQMKYMATGVSYEQLVNQQFKVSFPQAGWYTLIVRNQEREREYTTFFITKTD
jgi:hypothetical protein